MEENIEVKLQKKDGKKVYLGHLHKGNLLDSSISGLELLDMISHDFAKCNMWNPDFSDAEFEDGVLHDLSYHVASAVNSVLDKRGLMRKTGLRAASHEEHLAAIKYNLLESVHNNNNNNNNNNNKYVRSEFGELYLPERDILVIKGNSIKTSKCKPTIPYILVNAFGVRTKDNDYELAFKNGVSSLIPIKISTKESSKSSQVDFGNAFMPLELTGQEPKKEINFRSYISHGLTLYRSSNDVCISHIEYCAGIPYGARILLARDIKQ